MYIKMVLWTFFVSHRRNGGGSSTVGVHFSPQRPLQGEGVIRADLAGPKRESEARELLLQSDIIRVGGAQTNVHEEREGPCRGPGSEEAVQEDPQPLVCQDGPRGGRWQFGRLLLPPWKAGQGKVGAWPERRFTEEQGKGQVKSYGGGAGLARRLTLLPGDDIKQEGDWVERGCDEKLQFRRSQEKDGMIEDAEAKRSRKGALLGMVSAAVQGGFQVASPSVWEASPTEMECLRKPTRSDTGAEDQEEICREEDRMSPFRDSVQHEDQLLCYREEQTRENREEQAGGYREEQAGGYREKQAAGFREEQMREYREEQAGGLQGGTGRRLQGGTGRRLHGGTAGRLQEGTGGRIQGGTGRGLQGGTGGRLQERMGGRLQEGTGGRLQGGKGGRMQGGTGGRLQGGTGRRLQGGTGRRLQGGTGGRRQGGTGGMLQGGTCGRRQQ